MGNTSPYIMHSAMNTDINSAVSHTYISYHIKPIIDLENNLVKIFIEYYDIYRNGGHSHKISIKKSQESCSVISTIMIDSFRRVIVSPQVIALDYKTEYQKTVSELERIGLTQEYITKESILLRFAYFMYHYNPK